MTMNPSAIVAPSAAPDAAVSNPAPVPPVEPLPPDADADDVVGAVEPCPTDWPTAPLTCTTVPARGAFSSVLPTASSAAVTAAFAEDRCA
ncbi:hypothetical protein [Streptomyces sp. NRRL S-337]|uniref:hypothetical protein n=1 Tax=Streptomyces sp. NRRL S-337 TaxID=1463900 RepID=UPI00131C6800|nr:hypothetical protein [Streptomyces sp. NRRL S-337]